MVLDVVVCAAGQVPAQLLPFIAVDLMHLEQHGFLLASPLGFAHQGVQVIIPSLAALLASALFLPG